MAGSDPSVRARSMVLDELHHLANADDEDLETLRQLAGIHDWLVVLWGDGREPLLGPELALYVPRQGHELTMAVDHVEDALKRLRSAARWPTS